MGVGLQRRLAGRALGLLERGGAHATAAWLRWLRLGRYSLYVRIACLGALVSPSARQSFGALSPYCLAYSVIYQDSS